MKRLLLLMVCLYPAYAFTQISIKQKSTLKEVFLFLQEKHGFNFMYSNDEINDSKLVDIRIENASIEEILNIILKELNVSYIIKNKQILLIKKNEINQEIITQPQKRTEKISVSSSQENVTIQHSERSVIAPIEIIPGENPLLLSAIPKHSNIITRHVTENNIANNTVRNIQSPRFSFSLHSNALFLLAVTPNIGVGMKIKDAVSIKLQGAWTHFNWSNETKTYRLLAFYPEICYHFGTKKQYYLGTTFLAGKLNWKTGQTGKQGNFTGGGLTGGYIYEINDLFSIDFGLGFGHFKFKYDSYYQREGIDVKERKDMDNAWLPVKAGINFIWKIN